jgi:hypothetical protein
MTGPAQLSVLMQRARQTCIARHAEEKGKVEVFVPRFDVCLTLVEGHLSAAGAQRIIEALDRQFQRGAFDTFHDWEQMTGYDSAARQALTAWVVSSFRRIRCVHFLVTNRMVRMGISAANAATSLVGLELTSFHERAGFEAELGKLL